MDEGIVNKVAQSGLIQFDLSKHWPDISSIEYDIAADLWQGIALKEKTFREKRDANVPADGSSCSGRYKTYRPRARPS